MAIWRTAFAHQTKHSQKYGCYHKAGQTCEKIM